MAETAAQHLTRLLADAEATLRETADVLARLRHLGTLATAAQDSWADIGEQPR